MHKQLVYSSFFITCSILLPFVFHATGLSGSVFLPMHLTVLTGGLFLGPRYGFLIGLLSPILSSIISGMPPIFPMACMMSFELAVYGLVSGFFYVSKKYNIYLSLILAILAGRVCLAILVALFGASLNIHIPFYLYAAGTLIKGAPGIAIQLILIPLLVTRLNKI